MSGAPLASALLGGGLIGLAASLLLLADGKIAGVSGILADTLYRNAGEERAWRFLFLLGLLSGGVVIALLEPGALVDQLGRAPLVVAIGGLLVGFGARLGSGCTSGHGVCGLASGSKRSLVATMTFMATGAATATLFGWVLS